MNRRWELYERLIDEIPSDLMVEEIFIGLGWIMVKTDWVGLAMTFKDGHKTASFAGRLSGTSARDIARSLKSWNGLEAAVALASINSFLNTPKRFVGMVSGASTGTDSRGGPAVGQEGGGAYANESVFQRLLPRLAGKKVAVVGHFPDLEGLREVASLVILERNPSVGDLPDPACEYVLADQDYVFITGTALTNKTLPRLLELSADAFVTLVGPSVPLTPMWFDYGVDLVAGTIVVHESALKEAVAEGAQMEIFERGAQMVQLPAGQRCL